MQRPQPELVRRGAAELIALASLNTSGTSRENGGQCDLDWDYEVPLGLGDTTLGRLCLPSAPEDLGHPETLILLPALITHAWPAEWRDLTPMPRRRVNQ